MALLTELTGNEPFVWKEMYQKVYDEIKAIISKETMLCRLNHDLPFLIFPNASDMHLVAHVSKIEAGNIYEVLKYDHCPALLNSRKLNNY